MRIAVPYENGNIFQHFGRSEAFKLYDVADGAVTAAAVVSTNGSGHGEGRAHHHTGDRRRHDAGRREQESPVTAIFTTL